ncbi:hypothetical protein FJMB80055_29870 [Enterobacter hormaechei]|mgnify:CR=1 FL=1|jgi:hypothetical protein|nr:hypothetical protein L354_01158 [Enterobacter sp. MGH 8]ESN08962.1 hypothetical protein L372_03437 [Enterobacter sp. MGH 26]EUM34413.1 hypothetical protein L407_03072 [Enterobacter sp. BWH 39]EUM59448.1 hypothetical protein L358_03951 [Enterobacter sp. MGH 12]EUM65688.1 hypothetical protein L357_03119 [Enterobacter sp. MGH 11]EUM71435.1 hypothetical protein L355_08745 [Enterobacter sp. MGH 9]EUM87650.1 hypothetical protein L351_08762 [Enterobacter sp. MGH 5]EUN04222.1 hypothetical protein
MPWTETRPMQRLDFIRACHAGTDSFLPSAVSSASVEKPVTNGFSVLTPLTCHLSLTGRVLRTPTPGQFLMISPGSLRP